MTANRIYRKQMDFGYVLGELEKGRGTQFDPQFVDILLQLIHEGTIDLNKIYHVSEEDAAAEEKKKQEEAASARQEAAVSAEAAEQGKVGADASGQKTTEQGGES